MVPVSGDPGSRLAPFLVSCERISIWENGMDSGKESEDESACVFHNDHTNVGGAYGRVVFVCVGGTTLSVSDVSTHREERSENRSPADNVARVIQHPLSKPNRYLSTLMLKWCLELQAHIQNWTSMLCHVGHSARCRISSRDSVQRLCRPHGKHE